MLLQLTQKLTDKASARALYVALSREDGVPLREIVAAHPVAFIARPVWIVPPTLVPQVLTPDAVIDLAVLDASAHMPVPQALPAFVRAEQVLVVGDPRRATSDSLCAKLSGVSGESGLFSTAYEVAAGGAFPRIRIRQYRK